MTTNVFPNIRRKLARRFVRSRYKRSLQRKVLSEKMLVSMTTMEEPRKVPILSSQGTDRSI